MTIPTGQGQACGPESADPMGSPLPGSRPDRAAANDRRYAGFLGSGPPKDQGGFGTEDMEHPSEWMGVESVRPSDTIAPPPDLASMGDASQSFGGN